MSSRRDFFGNFSLAFFGGLLGFSSGGGSGDGRKVMNRKKGISIAEETTKKDFDLIVVGGGISGVSAAISAARHGMKVAIVHNRAMFGGNSSSEVKLFPENNSGAKTWIKEGGLNEEFHTEERIRNQDFYLEGTMNAHWDLVLYEWVIREKNITPFLNTHMQKVFMKNKAEIESVYAIQLGTEKSFELTAPYFVDASGDGVLGGLAGADFRWGREARDEYNETLAPAKADETVMGNTLFFSAEDYGKPVPFKRPDWAREFSPDDTLVRRGVSFIDGGYWWIEVGMPFHPIGDNNELRHEILRQLLGLWDYIKNVQPDENARRKAENYGLKFVGFWPYKRASRRIIGDYVITQNDVQDPQRMKDAVAYGTWNIDVHGPGGIIKIDQEPYPNPGDNNNWQDLGTLLYDIPIRSLYSKKVNNLLMAGRPISCSYLAFASSRVLSTGSICGQAVGVVASLAQKYKTIPGEIAKSHATETQQILLRDGCYIPGIDNLDGMDLAKEAEVSASSNMKMLFPAPNGALELKFPYAQLFPNSQDFIGSFSLFLKSTNSVPTKLNLGLREASYVWDFRTDKTIKTVEATILPMYDGWVEFKFDIKSRPGSLYYIFTGKAPGIFWKSFSDKPGEESKIPVGTTAAYLPDKTSYSEKSETFRELFPDIGLESIPGAGNEGHWKSLTMGKSMSLKILPENNFPFSGENVNRGTNRPDKWTNIWISDPQDGFPVYLNLKWKKETEFNTIQITFDTDQNKRVILPLFRYPECVRDYDVEALTGTGWKTIVEERGNYVRRKVHTFPGVKSGEIRIKVLATNGASSARIYEVRVYNE